MCALTEKLFENVTPSTLIVSTRVMPGKGGGTVRVLLRLADFEQNTISNDLLVFRQRLLLEAHLVTLAARFHVYVPDLRLPLSMCRRRI